MARILRHAAAAAAACWLITGGLSPALAQLLFKPGEPYVNYAYEGYRSYQR